MDNYPIKILKPSESILRAFFTNNNAVYVNFNNLYTTDLDY